MLETANNLNSAQLDLIKLYDDCHLLRLFGNSKSEEKEKFKAIYLYCDSFADNSGTTGDSTTSDSTTIGAVEEFMVTVLRLSTEALRNSMKF